MSFIFSTFTPTMTPLSNKKIKFTVLGLAVFAFLSCADSPTLEFPSEDEVRARTSSSSTTTSSSSSEAQISSSSILSSSSSACTANDNDNTHYCSNGVIKPYGSVTHVWHIYYIYKCI